MTPMEALRAATIDGARYLAIDAELGSIEKGKLADLVVLDANPLENIRNTESIHMVMLNGRLYDGKTLDEIGNHPRERLKFWWEFILHSSSAGTSPAARHNPRASPRRD
jgi:cytosine/adenosine deaminase-related metal-dependent hydrolase